MISKKAQGLPLNTIIIAILVVVVLVVIILIFTGQLAGTTQTLRQGEQCRAIGGECVSAAVCTMLNGTVSSGPNCPTGTVCCTRGTTS